MYLHRTFALVLICFMSGCSGTGDPCTTTEAYVITGDDLLLCCKVEATAENQYWEIIGERVIANNHDVDPLDVDYLVELRNETEWWLTIQNIAFDDEGEYQCYTNGTGGTQINRIITVVVAEEPIISTTSPLTVLVEDGMDAVMQCSSYGTPDPVVSWFYSNGSGMEPMNQTGAYMTLTQISRDIMGQYMCEATNAVGTDSRLFFVSVRSAPLITVLARETIASLYQYAMVACIVEAIPPVTEVFWERGGIKLMNDDKHKMMLIRLGVGVSVMKMRVRLNDTDTGEYFVVATNADGTSRAVTRIIERGKSDPIVSKTPPPRKIEVLGRILVAECEVDNLGEDDYLSWYWLSSIYGHQRIFSTNPGIQITPAQYTPQFTIAGTYNLQVDHVKFEDNGMYVCEISGRWNYTMALTIIESPKCTYMGMDDEKMVNLTCSARYQGSITGYETKWEYMNMNAYLDSNEQLSLDQPGYVLRILTFPMSRARIGWYRCHIGSPIDLNVYKDTCPALLITPVGGLKAGSLALDAGSDEFRQDLDSYANSAKHDKVGGSFDGTVSVLTVGIIGGIAGILLIALVSVMVVSAMTIRKMQGSNAAASKAKLTPSS